MVLWFYRAATACIVLAIFVLGAGIGLVLLSSLSVPSELDLEHLIIRIISALAIAGLVLVAAKGLLSLIRAFLHEATRLLERRHALRFGKLFYYLKLGKGQDSIDPDLESIQSAFQWNKETPTAFQDIDPEVLADTIINQLARLPGSVLEKLVDKSVEKYSRKNEKSSKGDLGDN